MADNRILVVEDEAGIREMIRFALQREGYEVIEAEDVEVARISVADERPDLILLDWMLPGTSCLLYTSPSPRDLSTSRMPSSA